MVLFSDRIRYGKPERGQNCMYEDNYIPSKDECKVAGNTSDPYVPWSASTFDLETTTHATSATLMVNHGRRMNGMEPWEMEIAKWQSHFDRFHVSNNDMDDVYEVSSDFGDYSARNDAINDFYGHDKNGNIDYNLEVSSEFRNNNSHGYTSTGLSAFENNVMGNDTLEGSSDLGSSSMANGTLDDSLNFRGISMEDDTLEEYFGMEYDTRSNGYIDSLSSYGNMRMEHYALQGRSDNGSERHTMSERYACKHDEGCTKIPSCFIKYEPSSIGIFNFDKYPRFSEEEPERFSDMSSAICRARGKTNLI